MLAIIAVAALAGSAAAQSASASGAVTSSSAPAPSTTPAPSPTSTVADSGTSPIPLASMHFTWGNLPYKVDDWAVGRGPQFGYNLCNATTQNQDSDCQTLVINDITDFCLWGPPIPNSTIGDTEGEEVAWCTKTGHGTRVIPPGAITAVQFMKTPSYVQVTGFINQAAININPGDGGGELDPHGADLRGNPLGALVFSDNLPSSTGNYLQAVEWHNFMGSGMFCFKACDPADPNAANFCQHIFDRIGCQYNAPAAYAPGVFESCLGDDQDFPGVYTGSNGVVSTYTQPAESLGPISTMPYTARIPASSSCTTYSSAQIFAASIAGVSGVATGSTSGSMATITAVGAGTTGGAATSKSTTTTKASGNAAGGSVKFGMGGVWSVVVGIVGIAVGAVVAL